MRDDLLDYLDTIGLNTFRLMPDLQSVCHAVKRKVTEDRQAASTLFKKKSSINLTQSKNNNIERVHDLLKEGFKRYKREDNYANIASVGSFIKRKDPTFDVHDYGFSKLSDLIMSFPNKYEVKKEDAHKVPVVVYRCLSS